MKALKAGESNHYDDLNASMPSVWLGGEPGYEDVSRATGDIISRIWEGPL